MSDENTPSGEPVPKFVAQFVKDVEAYLADVASSPTRDVHVTDTSGLTDSVQVTIVRARSVQAVANVPTPSITTIDDLTTPFTRERVRPAVKWAAGILGVGAAVYMKGALGESGAVTVHELPAILQLLREAISYMNR